MSFTAERTLGRPGQWYSKQTWTGDKPSLSFMAISVIRMVALLNNYDIKLNLVLKFEISTY
jgi:hypothetical protein